MTEIGFVIQPGESIPDDVTRVVDCQTDSWARNGDRWQLANSEDTNVYPPTSVQHYAPLTVTAVREPERKPFPEEAAYWTDDADGDPAIAVREPDPICDAATCEKSGHHHRAGVPALHVDEHFPSEAAGVSPLLDLVTQYGANLIAASEARENHSDESPFEHAAEALLARIAELLPQQPVQARDEDGNGWWIHDCGEVGEFAGTPSDDSCDRCSLSGPWRPLLVGADPAPEPDPLRCPTCDSQQPSMHPAVGGGGEVTGLCADRFHAVPGRPERCLCGYVEAGQAGNCVCGFTDPNDIQGWRNRYAEPQPDLIAQVMAELGVDRPEDVLGAIAVIRERREYWKGRFEEQAAHGDDQGQAILTLHSERDEARAEVERYQRLLKAQASNFSAAYNKLAEATPAQSDPLVLSLPTVPEGAEVFVGQRTGTRYSVQHGPRLSEVLDREGVVRVEMAPPREPRTWPKLDGPPEDLTRFKGASGNVWRRGDGDIELWCWADSRGALHGFRTFAEIQHEDGPLTEVFDEPGGAR